MSRPPAAAPGPSRGAAAAPRPAEVLGPALALTAAHVKLMFRDFATVFWSLAFPVVMVIIFGEAYGNEPRPELGGRGFIDVFIPGLIAIGIAATAFYQVGVGMVERRERQVFRRLRATPVPPWPIIFAGIFPGYLMILLTAAAVAAAGRLVYGAEPGGSLLTMGAAVTLGAAAFLALAAAAAGLIRSAAAANALATGINMIMMVFSGAIIPLSVMPERFQKIGSFIPLTYVLDVLRAAFNGDPLTGVAASLYATAGFLVAGVAASIITFRWD